MSDADPCKRAGRFVAAASRIAVLTGAGISTESGIPDFRSPGGLWSRYDPSKLTYDRFLADSETRRTYWEIATQSYPIMRDAQPNAAHRAVAGIEREGKLLKLVTQNVDGLHQKAGSSDERTIEIHGSALRARCTGCGAEHDREAIHRRLARDPSRTEVPACEACGGPLKPATISFGQAMPERETAEAFAAASECDLMIVIGSSLVVYPAAAVPEVAVRSGAPLVIVNREPTGHDRIAHVVVGGAAGESMSRIAEEAGMDLRPPGPAALH
ncbi:MAG: NAD-dependent protein deacylase [Myxococcales bacterium]|nr:MAG: NAD-dependent protein deacylase [Myxococcales bacterium]